MDCIKKIEQAGMTCKTGSLEAGVAALLLQMAKENNTWAELLAQDLDVKEMNLTALAKELTAYARKHKVGGGFFMDDACARKIIMDFYKLPEVDAPVEPPAMKPEQKPAPSWGSVDLLDLL